MLGVFATVTGVVMVFFLPGYCCSEAQHYLLTSYGFVNLEVPCDISSIRLIYITEGSVAGDQLEICYIAAQRLGPWFQLKCQLTNSKWLASCDQS